MARKAGRNGKLYLSLDGSAAATPTSYLSKFNFNGGVNYLDVTAMSDSNKVYVAGLADAKGTCSGFYDAGGGTSGIEQLYNASRDGVARNFYFYLDALTPTVDYFYGSALWDFQIDTGSDAAIAFTSNWQAAGAILLKR